MKDKPRYYRKKTTRDIFFESLGFGADVFMLLLGALLNHALTSSNKKDGKK